jgi:hypothetical protein
MPKSVHPSRHFPERSYPTLVIPTGATRISYFALPATTTCAALRKESCIQIIKATGLHRKSGGAQWSVCSLRAVAIPNSVHPSRHPPGNVIAPPLSSRPERSATEGSAVFTEFGMEGFHIFPACEPFKELGCWQRSGLDK